MAGVSGFGAFALWYLYNSRVRKVKNFQAVAWQRIRTDFLRRERLLLALPVLALWPITASGFTYLKSVIPLVHPFYLDPALAAWDRTLHFGIDPWRYLQPLLGYAPITYLIGFGYTLWFLILQAVLVLQAGASGNRKRRLQFLLTMALAWAVVGSLIATMMSSVGPCYFGLTYDGPDPFAEQVAYLRGVAASVAETIRLPFTTTVLQDMLWRSYSTNDFGMVRGISAAPSMHIASTWIIARLAWDMGKAARIAGCAFLGFIFIGSIHLGWHYAHRRLHVGRARLAAVAPGRLAAEPSGGAGLPVAGRRGRGALDADLDRPLRIAAAGALRLARQHRRLAAREQPGLHR